MLFQYNHNHNSRRIEQECYFNIIIIIIRSSPRDGLSTPYRSAFGSSCTKFVYPECWHFDNDATSKIDDVLTEHGGLLHVLPLVVHLRYFLLQK